MKGNKIAKRYALALFSLAKNDAELEKLKMDIHLQSILDKETVQ